MRMAYIFFKVWAFVTGGKVVILQDSGQCGFEETVTVARKSSWGDMIAKRHWPFDIHNVVLNEDGTVSGSYVKKWKYI